VETLKYSRNKLILRIAGAAAMCAFGIYLFSNPDFADELPFPWDWMADHLGAVARTGTATPHLAGRPTNWNAGVSR